MALISCPECGKKISDKAKKCPNCGYYPISEEGAKDLAFIKTEDGQHKDEPQNATEKWRIVMVAVACVIALCCIGVGIASYSLHKSEGGDSVSKEAVATRNDGKDEEIRTETSKPEKQGAALWEGYAAAHYKRGKEHLVHGRYEKAFIDYKKAEGLQDAGEQAALCAYKYGQSAMKEKNMWRQLRHLKTPQHTKWTTRTWHTADIWESLNYWRKKSISRQIYLCKN